MTVGIEIALTLLRREELKREIPWHTQSVWNYRVPLLELKRHFSSLGSKEDEELLVDKEQVTKKPKANSWYVYLMNFATICSNTSRVWLYRCGVH